MCVCVCVCTLWSTRRVQEKIALKWKSDDKITPVISHRSPIVGSKIIPYWFILMKVFQLLKRIIWNSLFSLNDLNKVRKVQIYFINEIHGWIYALLRCGFEIITCKMLFQIQNTGDFIEQNPYLLLQIISSNLYGNYSSKPFIWNPQIQVQPINSMYHNIQ